MKNARSFGVSILILAALSMPAAAQEFGSVDIMVAQRDNLTNICRTYGIDSSRIPHLASVNRISDPDLILPGQVIRVPVEWIGGVEDEGIVEFVRGEAVRKSKLASAWTPLTPKDVIRSGDELRTGDGGRLEVAFRSGNVLAMRPKTELTVLLTRKFNEGNIFQRIILGAGKIIARVKDVTGRTSRYEIKTPSAIAAARGTEFRIGWDESEITRAEIAKGRVGVEASGITVEVGEGEGTVIRKGEPPAAPRKLLPPPSFLGLPGRISALPLTLGISDVAGASGYRIVLSLDPEGRRIVREIPVKAGTEAVLPSGIEAGSYFLSVAAFDQDALEGPASPPVSLIVSEARPLEPLVPADGSILAGPAIEIRWPDIPRTGRYHLQIAEDEAFERMVVNRVEEAAGVFPIPAIKPGFYWLRARAVSVTGSEEPFGPVRKFQVISLPEAPRLSEPDIKRKSIVLNCTNLGPGVVYRFQLSRDEHFRTMTEELLSAKPGISFIRPPGVGIYHARVAAVSVDGFEGPFSEVRSFRIARSGLFRFICLVPAILLLIVLLV